MNFSFLFAYALSNSILGQFGDRMDLKYFVLIGMLVSCISFGGIGLSYLLGIRSIYYFPFLMALNGAGQATGFPGSIAILGNWFGIYLFLIIIKKLKAGVLYSDYMVGAKILVI